MTSQRVKNAQTYTEKDEQLQQIIRKLDEAENGQRESRKEQNKKELVRSLKSIFPGIKGRLHELCKPKQKKYETAVGIVLGRHWDSLVVDSEKTGRDVIQYLKEQRKGQITCMPIDAVQVKAINANLKTVHRGAKLAIDTLDYDSAYERVMSAVCGNAMICDDDKVAKFLLYEKGIEATAVTTDGKKFSKGGLITGGQGPNDQKRRWDDTEVEKLRTVMDKLRSEISTLNPQNDRRQRQDEEALQGELSGLEQKLRYLQDEAKSLERNAQSKKKELDHAKSQLKEANPKYQEQAQGVESIRTQLAALQSSIGAIEDQVFAQFCQRLGYTDIRAFEAQQGSAQQEALKKKQDFSTHVKRLQNQLSLETHQLQQTKDRIKRIEDNSKRDRDLIKSLETEKESIQDELDVLRAELDQLTEQLTELQTRYDEQAERVAEQRREFKKRTSNVDDKVKLVQDLEAEMQRKSAERYALLRKCRIEEIKIPLAEGSNDLSHLPLNTVQNVEDPDAMDVDGDETLMPELSNDYGIEIDFDELDEDFKEVSLQMLILVINSS
jgi:structural maintenance of chromosome 1